MPHPRSGREFWELDANFSTCNDLLHSEQFGPFRRTSDKRLDVTFVSVHRYNTQFPVKSTELLQIGFTMWHSYTQFDKQFYSHSPAPTFRTSLSSHNTSHTFLSSSTRHLPILPYFVSHVTERFKMAPGNHEEYLHLKWMESWRR